MRFLLLLVIVSSVACKQNSGLKSEASDQTTTFVSNDTVPEVREDVSTKPVASYIVPIGNPALKYKFGVNVYETHQTFHYLLKMQYEGMFVTDTLKLPNFGTWPEVQVKNAQNKLSCIIGFLDRKKEFKEYKLLTVEDKKLKLKVLKRYSVGVYRDTKAQQ